MYGVAARPIHCPTMDPFICYLPGWASPTFANPNADLPAPRFAWLTHGMMKLFQYWDTGEPPEEVAGWIEGFRAMNPDMTHRLYDQDSASWFIGKHLGQREQRAFDACAVPAMQADYFRLCALGAKGGVWFDADCIAARPLATLIERIPSLLLVVLEGGIINSALVARAPRNPFLCACLAAATNIIETRQFDQALKMNAILSVAGPGLLTAVWTLADPDWPAEGPLGRFAPPLASWDIQSPTVLETVQSAVAITAQVRSAIAGATFLHLTSVQKWGRPGEPRYKDSSRHWLHWQGSIYRKPHERPLPKARPSGSTL